MNQVHHDILRKGVGTLCLCLLASVFSITRFSSLNSQFLQFTLSPKSTCQNSGKCTEYWEETERHFTTLIGIASRPEELKRIYRRMFLKIRPVKNPENPKNAKRVWINLSNVLTTTLADRFGITNTTKRTAQEWLKDWANVDRLYANRNEDIVEHAVEILEERARDVARSSRSVWQVSEMIRRLIQEFSSLSELAGLLDLDTKELFGERILSLMGKNQKPVAHNVSIDDLWSARPILEKLFVANSLTQGEIIHLRIGASIRRAVVLESISAPGARLKLITTKLPSEDWRPLKSQPPKILEIAVTDIARPDVDIERESIQSGWPINVGDRLQFPNRRPKLEGTVIDVYGGQYTVVCYKKFHDETDPYLGYAFYPGKKSVKIGIRKGHIIKLPVRTLLKEPFDLVPNPNGLSSAL